MNTIIFTTIVQKQQSNKMSWTLYSPIGIRQTNFLSAPIEQKQNNWVEPMEKRINYAQTPSLKLQKNNDLLQKKVTSKEIFGSNLFLSDRETRLSTPSEDKNEAKKELRANRVSGERALAKPDREHCEAMALKELHANRVSG